MNIKLNKNSLVSILNVIINITNKKTNTPLINNLLLETIPDRSDAIMVKATNYEVSIEALIPAEVIEPASICLNAHRFYAIVREIIAETINLTSTQQKWINISGGLSKIKLPGISAEDYPPLDFNVLENRLVVESNTFKKAIDRTLFAIADVSNRINFTGLNFTVLEDKNIRWLSADGFRICQYFSPIRESECSKESLIIPKKSILEIRKILDFGATNIALSFNDNTFQVVAGDIHFRTKLIEESFPNVDTLILNKGSFIAEVPKYDLANALKVLSVLGEEKHSMVKLTFSSGELLVESEKHEFGEGQQIIACQYTGSPLVIGFNAHYLQEVIHNFEASKSEIVTMYMGGTESPCIFESHDWPDYKTVLMPMRINAY